MLLGFLHVYNVACKIFQTLKSACPGCIKLCDGRLSSKSTCQSVEDSCVAVQFLEVVAAATAAYLKESAGQFASELWKLVASGLSIQAHDRLVFGTHGVEDGQDAKGPPMTAAGAPHSPCIAGSTNVPTLILTLPWCLLRREWQSSGCEEGTCVLDTARMASMPGT